MLKIPVYLRGNSYYIHTRIAGRQFKKSLHTNCKHTARIRALSILTAVDMALDPKKLRTFNIDIKNGIYQSDGPEDYQNMMGALDKLGTLGLLKPTNQQPQSTQVHRKAPAISLRLPQLVDKLFELKKQLKPATAQAYKKAASEFSGFLGNPYIHEITGSDVTLYQEHLAKINDTRTIDNKIGNLSAIFSFAITQKYYFEAQHEVD